MVAIPLLEGTNQGDGPCGEFGWLGGGARFPGSSCKYSLSLRWDDDLPAGRTCCPSGSGWTLPNYNVSISDNGVIVGTGDHNGATRAFATTPVPATPTPSPTGTPTPTPAPITTRLVVSVLTAWYQHFPFSVMGLSAGPIQ